MILLALLQCNDAQVLIDRIRANEDMPAIIREDLRREVRDATPKCYYEETDGNVRRD